MSLISSQMEKNIKGGSMIRKMFETGAILRKEHGDKVCDFSLGNPDLAPPPAVRQALLDLAKTAEKPASLGYMPNAGFEFARASLAKLLSKEQGIALSSSDLLLTCGAAGGIHVFFRTILEQGDEVLGISPYFVEYNHYVNCHNGVFKTVPALDTFMPDLVALEAAMNEKTRAVLINSPNNPTGVIYSAEAIQGLIDLVERMSKKYNRTIYLASDEPYRDITYEESVPTLLDKSGHCVLLGSFSKNIALAGERVGYVALSPLLEGRDMLMAGLIQANRFLGFVNAPVVGQYLMDAALNSPDYEASIAENRNLYIKRRDILAEILEEAGIEFIKPQGTFYFFPKSPVADESIFVEALKEELILAVAGSGFGRAGHIRLSFAVPDFVITQSAKGFKRAVDKVLAR